MYVCTYVCLSVCLYVAVCLSVCLSVGLSVCLCVRVCLRFCPSLCLSVFLFSVCQKSGVVDRDKRCSGPTTETASCGVAHLSCHASLRIVGATSGSTGATSRSSGIISGSPAVTSGRGRIEVFHGGKFWRICGRGFGEKEAAVACKQAGFKEAAIQEGQSFVTGD